MRRLVRGIGRKVSDILNLDMMSEAYQILVLNYVLFMLYYTLESTFVNTLLYTVWDDMSIVVVYRAITFSTSAVTMNIAAYICQKKTPVFTARLSAAFYTVMYLLLFFGLSNMRIFMVPVAIFSGMGGAFYWAAHTLLVSHYSTKGNRDLGVGILGIVQGLMTLLAPVVSGFVIKLMHGNTGYRVMFGVGMLAVLGQVLVQRRFAPIEQKKHVSQAKLAFRLLRKKLSYQLMCAYEFFRGMRDGAFAFILNMLLFEIITDESLVGINTFLTGAASIFGNWVYGRVMRPNTRGRATLLCAAVLTVFSIPLFFVMNPVTLMIFTLISSFVTLFIVNSVCNTTYDVISQNETTRACMSETVAIREIALVAGRLCGLGVLIAFPRTQQGNVSAILVLTLSQFLCGLFMVFAERALGRKKLPAIKEKAVEPQ